MISFEFRVSRKIVVKMGKFRRKSSVASMTNALLRGGHEAHQAAMEPRLLREPPVRRGAAALGADVRPRCFNRGV